MSGAHVEAAGFIYLDIETHFDPEVCRFVAGSRKLDVWSSGDTDVQARDRAVEAITLFLNEITRLGTVGAILREAHVEVHRDPEATPSLWVRLRRLATGGRQPVAFSIPRERSSLVQARRQLTCTPQEFQDFAKANGWEHVRSEGSHESWEKAGARRVLVIDVKYRELPDFIISGNLRTMGLTRKDLREFLGR